MVDTGPGSRLTSGISVRTARDADFDTVQAVFGAASMTDFVPNELDRLLFEPARALVAMDGSEVVGTARAMTRDLSVPGDVVAAAHVTGVGVRATHRRRGVMSALITRQLREIPEALAVLWASEPAIYGRFGYGAAAWGTSYDIDLHRVGPPHVRPAGIYELGVDQAVKKLPAILRGLQLKRPGVSGRSDLRWEKRLQDQQRDANHRTGRRILAHRDTTGSMDGYAMWRGELKWGTSGPAGEVLLEELVATAPAAYEALWTHMLTLDLAATVKFAYAGMDEPLQQLVGTPTALRRQVRESLWIRITDVPRALEQRRYTVPLDLVLDVTDELVPRNSDRFRLTADGQQVNCERTTAPADLSLSVTEIGAVYLGGRGLAEFAATGRVTEHSPGALNTATAAFSWPLAPVGIELF